MALVTIQQLLEQLEPGILGTKLKRLQNRLYRSVGFQMYGTEPMAILTPSGYKGKVLMWLPLQRGAPAA